MSNNSIKDLEHPSTNGSFLSAFADYVDGQRDDIGRRWTQLVRPIPQAPDPLHPAQETLQGHVPELLAELVVRMRSSDRESRSEDLARSLSRGPELRNAGSNISDLIGEIYTIRRVLTRSILEEFVGANPEYSQEEGAITAALIHDFFHNLTCNVAEQFVEEQQRAFQEKIENLRRSGESRARLTRTVSHELRNLLQSLTLGVRLLAEEDEEGRRRDLGQMCSKQLTDIERTLNDLLDYSVLIGGHTRLAGERVSLPELFEEIVSQWQPLAKEHGLKFEHKCDPSLDTIVSDRLKLKQIAGNLLSNAIKYRKSAQGGYAGISFSPYGKTSWKMVVVDTGIGIAREDLESLFGEFTRIRPSAAIPGTGLGLAISKEFVELLGGQIEVFSESDHGSRFEVTLPMSQTMPAVGENSGGITRAR